MELILEKGLSHQQKAVEAISAVFENVEISDKLQEYYQNPVINLQSKNLLKNIKKQQEKIIAEHRGSNDIENYLNLDIKMETGTGKTYVYTNTIYELHRQYKMNKFIIVVPSLSIKAGTKQFIEDSYTQKHFADVCGYDSNIELLTLEAQKNKKGKRYFPASVRDFVIGSCQDKKKIYVLLVNMQLLTSGKMLSRDDYDYGVESFYQPLRALEATRPVVIIDEPHRFSKGQKAFSVITEKIKPQCIIRFGATFPEITKGKGKNKYQTRDYHNLIYELDACDAFNQNLIKGIAKEHFESLSHNEEKLKIVNMKRNDYVTFHHIMKDKPIKTYTLKVNEPLSLISSVFEGITITAIKSSSVEFSNGLEKNKGEELDINVYMNSYQEQMLKLALRRHFEAEKINFCQRRFKIKTLALFFIDDIHSYRVDKQSDKKPYLLEMFEKLLREYLKKAIDNCNDEEIEYRLYLEYSLKHIGDCHAGYFSEDNSDTDESIAKEVNDILHNKKMLLSFKNLDGTYNVRRFLFSKWTLKEGWDNPNIFTITKLRSSGSENSKLQEVGRGLRLPVDENGHRVSEENFYLNYIVDFTEADFAQKLINQINGERPSAATVTDEMLRIIADKRGIDSTDQIFFELGCKGYIDRNRNISSDKREQLFNEYPEIATGLNLNKIKDVNRQKPVKIKIRPKVYDKLKNLWETLNQNYVLIYDKDIDNILTEEIDKMLDNSVFTRHYLQSFRQKVDIVSHIAKVKEEGSVEETVDSPLLYGEFLKRINKLTGVPVKVFHKAMINYAQKHKSVDINDFINEQAVNNFVTKFSQWKKNFLQGRFRYKRCDTFLHETALSNSDGTVKSEIVQGRIGTRIVEGKPCEKYLYDKIAYDSDLEKDNILSGEIDNIIVYGKIPRRSIAIPTITGGTYSPDFMYVIKRTNGEKELNIIVETKDVKEQSNLRDEENIKIDCAKIFFEQLKQDGYDVKFKKQLSGKKIKAIIDEVLDFG
ncbi:type III restriction-modification system StyLTI enzyme res [Megamonas hypermegale]|uniref:Type III restriction-modification system StyLTI enzyme res n=1 Tax=Megamonas hypermegale TaxID=158847 RepID=A0A239U101_9FIRM|nr:type III restriction-modification system endonuclease [Megamonas hypermegale]SNV03707.1 type III restriction-modification system StyLTI enzyme res [Megamonas hypermegale]